MTERTEKIKGQKKLPNHFGSSFVETGFEPVE